VQAVVISLLPFLTTSTMQSRHAPQGCFPRIPFNQRRERHGKGRFHPLPVSPTPLG